MTNVVTSMAVQKYCEENSEDIARIEQILKEKNIYLSDAPVVRWEMLASAPVSVQTRPRAGVLRPAFSPAQ